MPNPVHQKISDIITSYSGNSSRLSQLLAFSVGRICIDIAKRGGDWESELHSVDLRRIANWMNAAITDNEPWLNDVDNQGNPKKIMEFTTLHDITKETYRGVLNSEEELFMELENGYYLVKLLSHTARVTEQNRMNNDIRIVTYLNILESSGNTYLSLRKNDNALATLVTTGNSLTQYIGKRNRKPSIKYTNALKPYFKKYKINCHMPVKEFGYVVDSDGIFHNPTELPDNLQINGTLNLEELPITSLPPGFKVNGSLNLSFTPIVDLPKDLKVAENLYLSSTPITSLPSGLEVGGNLNLLGTKISLLPDDLKVGGEISLSENNITSLLGDTKLNGGLFLFAANITTLPDGLEVSGNLNLTSSKIESLPNNLKVGGTLELRNTNIFSLPSGLVIGKDLNLEGSQITSLPYDLVISGGINLRRTRITELPPSIRDDAIILTDDGEISAVEFRILHQTHSDKFMR